MYNPTPQHDTPAAAVPAIQAPESYALKNTREVRQDGRLLRLIRYEKSDGSNAGLGGEHFSYVVDAATDRLMGSTYLDARLSEQPLPDKETARAVAMAFVARVAPDLSGALSVLWIEPHSETITVAGPQGPRSLQIIGQKVKCHHKPSSTYTWVIVGANAQIITFERDIIWSTARAQRVTEKWLHDTWLKAHEKVSESR